MSEAKEVDPAEFHETFHAARREVRKVVAGQEGVVEHLLASVFADGHVLLKGPPGLGRTLMVRTLAHVLGLDFRRIQFSPDLLPTDILGAEVLESNVSTGERKFRFFKGPVFANLILADEVNRSPTRTQAALLEVMQERQVTSVGHTYFLPKPFILIATQNTLETEGVWTLSEAQTDRFLMMIEQDYPQEDEERRMLRLTTGSGRLMPESVADAETIQAMQRLAREVPVVPSVKDFALSIVRSSRPGESEAVEASRRDVRLGASPRAAQALLLSAKVLALARGRRHVTRQDVIRVTKPVMAHRLLMDVRAHAEGRGHQQVIDALIQQAKQKSLAETSRWTRELLKI
ncbi:MAG: MoxR family ATPase [Planctomycetota bacterium]|jgi:MoxR-like ATPase|nr:MoxR family ATPase [Planctomycetota bacterium]MDP6504416.1 MoxR family ATPase [Planctomycetota bacterium]